MTTAARKQNPDTRDDHFMRRAIKQARQGVQKGQTPFGACVVKGNRIIAESHNKVLLNKDITAHAEVMALRLANKKTKNVHVFGATLYSTCEPCPMCFAAAHWAGISRIVFGANIQDAEKFGFRELKISNRSLKQAGKVSVTLKSGVLRGQVLEIFKLWQAREDHRTY